MWADGISMLTFSEPGTIFNMHYVEPALLELDNLRPVLALMALDNVNTVNPEIFARIIFSRIALKDIFAALKLRD